MGHPERKYIFQPLIFSGYASFRGGNIYLKKILYIYNRIHIYIYIDIDWIISPAPSSNSGKFKGLGLGIPGRLNMFHVILVATGMLGEGVDPIYKKRFKMGRVFGSPYQLLRKGKISKNKHSV